jgi:hypothetical protein
MEKVPLSKSGSLPSVKFFCRVYFIGHSVKQALPSATFGEERHPAQTHFVEHQTLGIIQSSAKVSLPSVKHSTKRDPRPREVESHLYLTAVNYAEC